MAICELCGKTPRTSYNVPKSVHKTARSVKPNLQKRLGLLICTRCARTLKKYNVVTAA